MKVANFNHQQDAKKFELAAPVLASEQAVKESWGVLNVAQVSQQNGEADGCWSMEYLMSSFCGTIGCDPDREMEAEIKAIWEAAS